jgi:hypothetical protein
MRGGFRTAVEGPYLSSDFAPEVSSDRTVELHRRVRERRRLLDELLGRASDTEAAPDTLDEGDEAA